MSKLIILRGPSAAGKSTVAKKLFENAIRPVVLIEQDHYRFIFKPAGGGSGSNSHTIQSMIKYNVAQALTDGYDVLLEGILTQKSYANIIGDLIASHAGESYMFYFDVSFEETVRRHQTKPIAHLFGADQMRDWYDDAHRSGHPIEQIVSENWSMDQTVEVIADRTRLY